MAQERLSMRNIQRLLRLHFVESKSKREIASSLNVGASTVFDYIARAKAAGILSWAEIENLSEADLEAKLGFTKPGTFGQLPLRKIAAMPEWISVHQEMSRPHVTLALLWQEYREVHANGYGYTQFCEHYKRWTRKLSVTMRQTHRAGEKAFVDYCDGLWLADLETGERVQTNLFVGCLGASSLTYAEATVSQTSPEWISSHVNMYLYFEGVSALTIPDNLKSGVTKTCRYEPLINETYLDMATHYGTCIMPARAYTPRDKAKVEAAVLVAQRWILARLRNRLFTNLSDMNKAIAECLEILNNRKMRHLNKTRRELFETIDKPALRSLPAVPYEYSEWKKARANIDYHVSVDHHNYSVPFQLVRELLDIRLTVGTVEVFHKSERVASHRRSNRRGGSTTLKDHMPRSHQAYAEWTPTRIVEWASGVGPNTSRLVEEIIKTKVHPELGYRAALGIIRLDKKYESGRVEAACSKALEVGAYSYKFVSEMLKNKMDAVESPNKETFGSHEKVQDEQLSLLGKENIRGAKYYH